VNERAVFLYECGAEPDRKIAHDAICLLSVAKRTLPVQCLLLAARLRWLHAAVAMTNKSFHPKTWYMVISYRSLYSVAQSGYIVKSRFGSIVN
jgi:hypothetical protein